MTPSTAHHIPCPIPADPRWLCLLGSDVKTNELFMAKATPGAGGTAVIPIKFDRREKRVLRKKMPIPVSVWAERHRVLPATARFKGPWRNANVAYLAGIMDASFFKSVEEIIVCAAPQTGKTESVYTCLGYAADRRPGNAMIVFPAETDAKDNAKDRLKPMFQDSPRLREYLTGYSDDLGGIKMTLQHMILYMAWSNSPGRLANRPVKYAHADEEDKYPATASKREGSPVDLLKKRMRTFSGQRKLWRTSSPTIESGPIWVALTKEAQVVLDYFVMCPVCGAMQKMVFEGIRWTDGVRDPLVIERTREVWYECKMCDARWDDPARDRAVRDGQWRDRATGMSLDAVLKSQKPMRIGFHLPAWLSPFVALWECSAAFLKGLTDKNKLKDFLNGFAAEPWKAVEQVRTEERILKLKDDRPAGLVPGGGAVACLMAGVDTQDNGFWYEIRAFGWGFAGDSWAIRSGFIIDFEALQKVLWEDVYKDAAGLTYPVQLVCQDAMGHRTADVYDFCRINRGAIFPCMGKDRQTQPFAYSNIDVYPGTKKQIPGGIILVRWDTNYFKNKLSSMLEVSPGDPGCWNYNQDLTDEWARQMTVEGINPDTGLWENPQEKPNHAWDCSALVLLAADIVGVRFWQRPAPAGEPEKKASAPARAGMW